MVELEPRARIEICARKASEPIVREEDMPLATSLSPRVSCCRSGDRWPGTRCSQKLVDTHARRDHESNR